MKIKKILWPDQFKVEIDGSIEIYVQDDNYYTYTVFITTPEDLVKEMIQQKINFIRPEIPKVIVKKLTKEIITEAIESYAADDGFWLKLHQFGNAVDISVLNKLNLEDRKFIDQPNEFYGPDELNDLNNS
jgi:hypothetical protein